jgi:hypothetical protein
VLLQSVHAGRYTHRDQSNLNSPVLPTTLQQVSPPIVTSPSCNNVFPVRREIVADDLCTGCADGSAGTCFGDRGSTLMIQQTSMSASERSRTRGLGVDCVQPTR